MHAEIFPDLADRRRWLPRYRRWLDLRAQLLGLAQQKAGLTDPADIETLEAEMTAVLVDLAALCPPERYLWLDGRPLLDRWAAVAEGDQ